jgi:hypothetical protein
MWNMEGETRFFRKNRVSEYAQNPRTNDLCNFKQRQCGPVVFSPCLRGGLVFQRPAISVPIPNCAPHITHSAILARFALTAGGAFAYHGMDQQTFMYTRFIVVATATGAEIDRDNECPNRLFPPESAI